MTIIDAFAILLREGAGGLNVHLVAFHLDATGEADERATRLQVALALLGHVTELQRGVWLVACDQGAEAIKASLETQLEAADRLFVGTLTQVASTRPLPSTVEVFRVARWIP